VAGWCRDSPSFHEAEAGPWASVLGEREAFPGFNPVSVGDLTQGLPPPASRRPAAAAVFLRTAPVM
jgi:hypothetical protein